MNDDFIFKKDNASCHKSNYTMTFFRDKNIELMDWLAQLPDMNPIDNLLSYIQLKLEKKY